MGWIKNAKDKVDQIVREEVDQPREDDELRQRRERKANEKKETK